MLLVGLMKDLNLSHNLTPDELVIRHAVANDCDSLLELMKELATFEDYFDDFCVTKQDLLAHGFSQSEPTFTALVAEQNVSIQAYLVYYLIPFTYNLKPTLFIKELYVHENMRGQNIGKKLMQRAIADAKEKSCGRMKWDVLSDNTKAQSFYKSFGAKYDARWQGYVLNV